MVKNQTTHRGFNDLSDSVLDSGNLVVLPRHDLEIEQPTKQGENEREHEGTEHEQPHVRSFTHEPLLPARTLTAALSSGRRTP